ncbi:MAG: hypothetical protein UR84_C0016G0017, partial [candidate division WS6 bacterium GW2011_GWD1_35_594]
SLLYRSPILEIVVDRKLKVNITASIDLINSCIHHYTFISLVRNVGF